MTTARLGLMMFLQFFVWGAWFVSTGTYLPAIERGDLVANTYAVSYLAAAVAPLFFSFLADRFLPAQVVLGLLHLGGAGCMFAIPVAGPEFFVPLIFAHMCCYAPTLGLTNAVAFNSVKDADTQFPIIRVFGTIGWIAAGYAISKIFFAGESAQQYQVTGGAGVLLGLYSFTLPNTPPAGKGEPFSFRKLLGVDAFVLFRDSSFTIFLICSTLLCLPLSLYYAYAAEYASQIGMTDVTFKMSFGQMSEVAFMVAMPLFFRVLGVKWMLLVGMLAWVVRYGLFAAAFSDETVWMVLVGILLHGICYDFFFVTGQLYVDKKAPPEIRSQAQGLLVLAIYGVGFTVGSWLSGPLSEAFPGPAEPTVMAEVLNDAGDVIGEESKPKYSINWIPFWLGPAGFALLTAFVFAILFRNPKMTDEELESLDTPGEIVAETDEPAVP